MKTIHFSDSWYSWIPTNLGILNFNYTADENNLSKVFGLDNVELIEDTSIRKEIKLQKTNLSDLNDIVKKVLGIIEADSFSNVVLEREIINNKYTKKNQTTKITGACNINFTNNIIVIYSNFEIELNGKITINNIKLEYDEDIIYLIDLTDTLKKTIANAIYTLVKKVVHGDNHHYQKIDTIIDVYTEFNPRQIITDLAFQIKRLEKFIKSDNKESILAIYNLDKEHSYFIAQGFQSYIQTFYNLFLYNNNDKYQNEDTKGTLEYISLENIKNVILSLKSNIESLKLKRESKKNSTVFMISLVALFSTLNIFYGTLVECKISHFVTIFNISRDKSILLLLFLFLFIIPISNEHIKNYFFRVLRVLMKKHTIIYTYFELFILLLYSKNLSKELSQKYLKEIKILKKYEDNIISYIVSYPISFLILSLGLYFESNFLITCSTITILLASFLSYKILVSKIK